MPIYAKRLEYVWENDDEVCKSITNHDLDSDEKSGAGDNCPFNYNPEQIDTDGDGRGDECDPCYGSSNQNSDADYLCDNLDNCPNDFNPDQADFDDDKVGDKCDNCLELSNPLQSNSDDDDYGDICDNCIDIYNDQSDDDGDSLGNECDPCFGLLNYTDYTDLDGFCSDEDNCPNIYNPTQINNDTDDLGDACDNCPNHENSSQADIDRDERGDACDMCNPNESNTLCGEITSVRADIIFNQKPLVIPSNMSSLGREQVVSAAEIIIGNKVEIEFVGQTSSDLSKIYDLEIGSCKCTNQTDLCLLTECPEIVSTISRLPDGWSTVEWEKDNVECQKDDFEKCLDYQNLIFYPTTVTNNDKEKIIWNWREQYKNEADINRGTHYFRLTTRARDDSNLIPFTHYSTSLDIYMIQYKSMLLYNAPESDFGSIIIPETNIRLSFDLISSRIHDIIDYIETGKINTINPIPINSKDFPISINNLLYLNKVYKGIIKNYKFENNLNIDYYNNYDYIIPININSQDPGDPVEHLE